MRMKFSKDDPIYYKVKLKELIQQALDQGLKVYGEDLGNSVQAYFVANNGNTAGVSFVKE